MERSSPPPAWCRAGGDPGNMRREARVSPRAASAGTAHRLKGQGTSVRHRLLHLPEQEHALVWQAQRGPIATATGGQGGRAGCHELVPVPMSPGPGLMLLERNRHMGQGQEHLPEHLWSRHRSPRHSAALEHSEEGMGGRDPPEGTTRPGGPGGGQPGRWGPVGLGDRAGAAEEPGQRHRGHKGTAAGAGGTGHRGFHCRDLVWRLGSGVSPGPSLGRENAGTGF